MAELLYDCYVLSEDRQADAVRAFLEHFLPLRDATRSEYEIPAHAHLPEHVLHSEAELLEYLHEHPREPYALYWNSRAPGQPRRAMAFFTSDGAVILGLSCDSSESDAQRWLDAVMQFLGGSVGTYWVESPAPTSSAVFRTDVASLPAGTVRLAPEPKRRRTTRWS